MGSQPDRRRSIALRGLRQNLLSWNLRQLLDDFVAQMIVGKNPDSVGWKQWPQPIHSLLNQRTVAAKSQHLFGARPAAARPKSRTSSTSQNQTVVIQDHSLTNNAVTV